LAIRPGQIFELEAVRSGGEEQCSSFNVLGNLPYSRAVPLGSGRLVGVNDEWEKELATLSTEWKWALHKAATTTDPELRDIFTDLANCFQGKVQQLRLKLDTTKTEQD
jgi:hypothetical protein